MENKRLDIHQHARALLGDKGYDADWLRAALTLRGIAPCIPSRANRTVAIPHDRALYRQRHKIKNMFGKLKDLRRIHTRYDRCAHTFAFPLPYSKAVSVELASCTGHISRVHPRRRFIVKLPRSVGMCNCVYSLDQMDCKHLAEIVREAGC